MRRLARIVLPVLVLGLGFAGAALLVATRPELKPSEPGEREWIVRAVTVELGDVRPELVLFGEIVAGREVEMRALVAGPVQKVGANFVDGGIVRKGELLVAIDPFEYQARLDETSAQLTEARARLREIEARARLERKSLEREREQLALTAREFDRIEKLQAKGTVSPKSLDDAALAHSKQRQLVSAREQAIEMEGARLDQQRAAITRLEVAVRRARHDLEQTRVMAPFDGFVLDVGAALGKRVGVNDRLARIVDADRLEVGFRLPDAMFGRIYAAEGGLEGRPAKVIWRTGAQGLEYEAVVERTGARIEAASGGVDLYARVLDAGPARPLRPGAFVEVRIADRSYAGVARLPESALHEGDTVYVVADGRLVARSVRIVARDGAEILVSGEIARGEQVVTTRFAEIAPGVRVEVR